MSTSGTPLDDDRDESRLWETLVDRQGLERASILIDLVWARLEQTKFDFTIPLAEEAVECARLEVNDQVLARALTAHGAALFNNEFYAESAGAHLAAALLHEKYDNDEATFGAYFFASWSMESAEQYEPGLEAIEKAIEIAERSRSWDELGAAFMHRADLLEDLKEDPDKVIESVKLGRNAFRQAGNVACVLEADTRLAHLYTSMEEEAEALEILENARIVAFSIDEERGMYVTFLLGHALQRMDRHLDALKILNECLDYAKREKSFSALAATLWEIALCTWPTDRAGAIRLLKESRAHYDAIGNDAKLRLIDDKVAEWLTCTSGR